MYQHKVQYYETDKMGITHHSNYIRWMEEARIDFFFLFCWSFARIEAEGIVSPVISVDVKYRKTTTFNDLITILVQVEEFNGLKLKIAYRMKNRDNELVCEGRSEHCFLTSAGKPIVISKAYPQFYDALLHADKEF